MAIFGLEPKLPRRLVGEQSRRRVAFVHPRRTFVIVEPECECPGCDQPSAERMIDLGGEPARQHARYAGNRRLGRRRGGHELEGRERAGGPGQGTVKEERAKTLQGRIAIVTRQVTD